MLLMPLICHLVAWKLDKKIFGFVNKGRIELQELAPELEPKKSKVEPIALGSKI